MEIFLHIILMNKYFCYCFFLHVCVLFSNKSNIYLTYHPHCMRSDRHDFKRNVQVDHSVTQHVLKENSYFISAILLKEVFTKMENTLLKYQLKSGNLMPMIGFGTFRIQGAALIKEVLDIALKAGYRAIDTAAVYGNERDIGAALKTLLPKYNLKREDIFITTKLSPSDHGDRATNAINESLEKLDCGYLDLYLIHWPGQSGTGVDNPKNKTIRAKTWEKLVEAKKQGLIRDIGVSNYTVKHLEELLNNSFGEVPAVDQVEWHPHYHQPELKKFCQQKGILLQAYSSLGGTNNPDLLTDATVVAIAKKLNKSPSQILLRWALQQNIAIIPKARSKKHIEENIDLNFEIPEYDMNLLGSMQTVHKYAWDPNVVV